MIEEIQWEGRVLALILRKDVEPEGVRFFTREENSLQLGILQHKGGLEIRTHIHRNHAKIIEDVQEILHVEYGKIEANFYSDSGKRIGSKILNPGDTILLISGGHGFKILEDSRIIEVKQGPYPGGQGDKVPLETSE